MLRPPIRRGPRPGARSGKLRRIGDRPGLPGCGVLAGSVGREAGEGEEEVSAAAALSALAEGGM